MQYPYSHTNGAQQQNPQHQHRNWGEVVRLHADIQKQKEEYERNLEKERQARYKEELDKILQSQKNEKDQQRRMDEELKRKYERESEEFKQRELMNRYNSRQTQANMAGDSLRDYQMRMDRERQAKEKEVMDHQSKYRVLAEQERSDKILYKEEKNAISKEIQKEYELESQYKMMNSGKEKIVDKEYMEKYKNILENQEVDRKKFFDKIRNHGQNDQVKDYYDRLYANEDFKKKDYEQNVIEKARIEKMIKDEENFRTKEINRERMKNDTMHGLQNQMLTKKEVERIQRQKELDLENEQLKKQMEDFDRKQRVRQEYLEKIKNENVQVLNKQLEDLQNRKNQEDWLSPLEEKFNRNDIEIIDQKVTPNNQFSNPSFVPGRALPFERRLQNQYINKSLDVKNVVDEIQKTRNTFNMDGGGPMPNIPTDRSRNNQFQPVRGGSDNLPYNANPPMYGNNYNSNNYTSSPQLYEPTQQNGSPLIRNQNPEFQRQNPGRNNYGSLQLQPNEYSNNAGRQYSTPQPNYIQPSLTMHPETRPNYVSQSVQDLRAAEGQLWKKDYNYVRNKNGPNSNPFNILSNEVRPVNTNINKGPLGLY